MQIRQGRRLKSMIGQNVTGELTVVVNGKELPSKGAVINGTTNAPVRALVDAVGGELTLEGKTINITTQSVDANEPNDNSSNKNSRHTKERLAERKKEFEEQLNILNAGKKELLDLIEEAQQDIFSTTDNNLIEVSKKKNEKSQKNIETFSDPEIEKVKNELKLVEEALQLFEQK